MMSPIVIFLFMVEVIVASYLKVFIASIMVEINPPSGGGLENKLILRRVRILSRNY